MAELWTRRSFKRQEENRNGSFDEGDPAFFRTRRAREHVEEDSK
jgi:hypothetical protein